MEVHLRQPLEGSCGPVLATFLQGPPPRASLFPALDSGSERDLEFAYAVHARRPGWGQLVGSSKSGIAYAARGTEESSSAAGYKYLLGYAKRGRLTLAPVETGGIFPLQMTTGLTNESGEGPSSDRARQALLISDFGSRKKKKMESSRQANIVDVRAVAAANEVGQHLQAASAAAGRGGTSADAEDAETDAPARGTLASKHEATLHSGRVAMLPPFDSNATTPYGAYPLHGIISDDVFAALKASARRVVHEMANNSAPVVDVSSLAADIIADLSAGSEHVSQRLRELLSKRLQSKSGLADEPAPDTTSTGTEATSIHTIKKSSAVKRASCLLYLVHLLQLHRSPKVLHYRVPRPPQTITAGDVSPIATEPVIPSLAGIPPAAVAALLAHYTEERPAEGAGTGHPSFVRTTELRDRLIAHIAVLALHIDDFSILDMRMLAADLRLPLAKLVSVFREAACTVEPVREAGAIVSYSVTLKAPLVFPRLRLGRK